MPPPITTCVYYGFPQTPLLATLTSGNTSLERGTQRVDLVMPEVARQLPLLTAGWVEPVSDPEALEKLFGEVFTALRRWAGASPGAAPGCGASGSGHGRRSGRIGQQGLFV